MASEEKNHNQPFKHQIKTQIKSLSHTYYKLSGDKKKGKCSLLNLSRKRIEQHHKDSQISEDTSSLIHPESGLNNITVKDSHRSEDTSSSIHPESGLHNITVTDLHTSEDTSSSIHLESGLNNITIKERHAISNEDTSSSAKPQTK